MAQQSILKRYFVKYLPMIILSVILSVGQNYLGLQLPLLIEGLVDVVLPALRDASISDAVGNKMLLDLFWTLFIIFTITGFLSLGRTLTSQYIGTRVVYEMRGDVFRSLQAQSYEFYDKNRTGDIMSRATRDVNITRNFLSNQFSNLIRDAFTLVVLLVIVFDKNWQLSLIFLSIMPILFFITIWFKRRMYKIWVTVSKRSGVMTSTLQENITGVRVVKAFAREEHELQKFNNDTENFLKSNLRVIKYQSNYGPSLELITQIGSVLLLVLGTSMVIAAKNGGQGLTTGEVAAFFIYFTLLYDPIRSIVNIYSNFSQLQASLERMNSILEHRSEIVEKKDAMMPEKIEGEYRFNNVWFSYSNNQTYALRGLDFKVKKGETLAILGATGSGKSTLINLIPRFYDPTKGSITLDETDLRDLKIHDYRRQIGMVSQDIFLFSRTIRENIAYGVPGRVKQDDIERVAKIASIHNFIISLPDGYKTKVGERGQTLSGGQKQRVAIARALLLDPSILVLDDSLSAVDIDTEAQIQKALDTLFVGRTTFIITQRISTVQNCDRILVLEQGEIVEFGTHEELYEMGGIYTRIYDTMYKANVKSKERKIRERSLEVAEGISPEISFEKVAPTDAKVLNEFYTATYPDEEKRQKVTTRVQSKIERRILRDERQLIAEDEISYLKKILEFAPHNVTFSLQELSKALDLTVATISGQLRRWKKSLPFTVRDSIISIPEMEEFVKTLTEMINDYEKRQEKKRERELLKEMKSIQKKKQGQQNKKEKRNKKEHLDSASEHREER